MKPPEGVPSWPGENFVISTNELPTPSSSTSRLHRLRTCSSRAFRHVFGTPEHTTPRPRQWRPPVSGHTTQRYGELEVHPFATAPVARVERERSQQYEQPGSLRTVDLIDMFPAPPSSDKHRVASNLPLSLSIFPGTDGPGPSQRALQALSGNAIPVSPRRARMQTEASQTWRSIRIPQGLSHATYPEFRDGAGGHGAESARPTPVQVSENTAENPHQHRTRRMLHGTWGKRISRTKCWRCELEARRSASGDLLRRSYTGLRAGVSYTWARLLGSLKYSCFCRYEGYER